MVLEVVLVVPEVVLVVLEVNGPQVSLAKFQTRLSLRPDLYSPAPPIPKVRCFGLGARRTISIQAILSSKSTPR